jgi:ligand-binding sensor domain-containing protein/signal transduction histidine kinase
MVSPGKRIARIAVLCAACLAAAALRGELLPVRAFTTVDGLPHDRVKRIRQDRSGFLWFATTEGLARFDGRSFVSYGVREGLPVPSVNDVVETADGLWVATNGGGIAFLGSSAVAARFRPVRVGEGAANRVNTLLRDARGSIWAGTDGGLYRLPAGPGTGPAASFEPAPLGLEGHPDPSVHVFSILETERGLLAGTRFGLVLLEGDGQTRRIPLAPGAEDIVLALARAPDGEVLAGVRGAGLFRLHPATLAVTGRLGVNDGLPDSTVAAIHASRERWVLGTDDGIAVVAGGRVRAYGVANGLSERLVTSVTEDREGNVWLGTPGGGATMVVLNGAALFGEADGLGRIASGLYERRSGEICVFSSNWTVSSFDGRRFRSVRPRLPGRLGPSDWRSFHGMVDDGEGMFWFATGEGVYRFGPVNDLGDLARLPPNLHLTTADGLAAAEASRLFLDRRGDLWIGTFSTVPDPLTRWRRQTGTLERFGAAQGLPPLGAPGAFVEDQGGNVWVAFRDGALVRYRSGRFEVMSGRPGIPEASYVGLLCDAGGRLWATTAGSGLVRIDRPSDLEPAAVVYGPAEGIRDFYLGRLLDDTKGRILIATSRATLLFDPARGAVTEVRAAGPSFPSEPLAALRDRTGTTWLATWRGLARVAPETREVDRRLRLLVSGVQVSGVAWPVPWTGTDRAELGELPPDSNLAVSFFCLGVFGEPVVFEHRVDGLDRQWSPGQAESAVHYGQLAPGRYRFRVRAAAGLEGTSGEAVVSFVVRPPVWRRWWFRVGTALLLAGIGYGAAAARTRKERALEEVRSRIASDLHDDLGASLSRISILSEVAARTVREGGSPAELVGKIGEASRSVVEKLADGIWAVDPRRDDLQSLAERLRQAAQELLEPSGVSWRVEVPAGADRLRLHPGRRRQIYLLLKEAIANAAKHSGAHHVTLEAAAGHGRLGFVLTDDGCGFSPDAPGGGQRLVGGRGLENMGRRAKALRGTLEVESAPGEGTVVRLEVPERGGA